MKKLFCKANISKFLLALALLFFAFDAFFLIYGIFENVLSFLLEIILCTSVAGVFLALYRIIDLLENKD